MSDDSLLSTDDAVGRMTASQRERRLDLLLADSDEIFETVVNAHAPAGGRHRLVSVCVLFSGGNDSTVLAHMFRDRGLCGAFASEGERGQVDDRYPMALEEVREMEEILQTDEYAHIPYHRRFWGWNGMPELRAMAGEEEKKHRAGALCTSCEMKSVL